MGKPKRKLSLKKETLRTLSGSELSAVQGGTYYAGGGFGLGSGIYGYGLAPTAGCTAGCPPPGSGGCHDTAGCFGLSF